MRGRKGRTRPVASAFFFFSKPPNQVIYLEGLPVTFAKNKPRAVRRPSPESDSLVLRADLAAANLPEEFRLIPSGFLPLVKFT